MILISGCTTKSMSDKYITENYHQTFIPEKIIVIDGDTVHIFIDKKKKSIRLKGIDAPEIKQPFGIESQINLYQCIKKGKITIHVDKKDKYDRYLGIIKSDGKDCNLYQLEKGYAWYYKQYEMELPKKQRELYESTSTFSMKNKKGIWTSVDNIAPWNWRKINR